MKIFSTSLQSKSVLLVTITFFFHLEKTCISCPVIFTVRNISCGKAMFSQACVKNSVHSGVYPRADTPLGRHPHPRADTLLGKHPAPPGKQLHLPPETATAEDGTHPTGMHSCSCMIRSLFVSFLGQNV